MCMLDTGESNNESTRTNADSMIYDKNKEFIFISVSGECFKLCSYENCQTSVKGGLKHKKRQDVSKFNRRHYYLQKR